MAALVAATVTEAKAGEAATATARQLPPLGAIFDLDGTLLDTEPLYEQAYDRAVKTLGASEYPRAVHALIVGRPEVPGAQTLVDQLGLVGVTPHQLLEARDEHLLHTMPDAKPFPGAVALVKHIKAHCKGVALATSSYSAYLELKRRNNGELFDLFDVIICGDNPKVKRGKPHPDIFLVAAEELGIPPHQCVGFEDSLAGTEAVLAAGMTCVAIPNPHIAADKFTVAHFVVDALEKFDTAAIGLPCISDSTSTSTTN